ncbi:MAG: tetratricopeptide repeat protein [Crocinitomicaceae bacterium]|nr:MAG: tetratricopeptide repeat protein [Crocinitomicaceae bacterium]
MKKITGIFILLLSVFTAKAQAPDYDDLKILYADANYEKLVKVAENYTLKDELKKDPIPFIWLGKGLYKLSLSGSSDEKFKNAYKDAVAAVGKAIKNDKDGTALSEFQDFVDEFQGSMVEMINNDLGAKDYSKASGWALKYVKVTRNPLGAKYLDGATKYRKSDKGGANTLWKECDGLLAKVTSIESWSKADVEMLKIGALQTAECYIASKQVEKAKTLLNKIAPWYEDDEDFKTKYDEIIN